MTNDLTTVRLLSRPTLGWAKTAGKLLFPVLALVLPTSPLSAQGPPQHWLHAGVMPPGAIGSQRLLSNGPLSVHTPPAPIQPVLVRAEDEAIISIVSEGGFTSGHQSELLAGLIVGRVYRLRVAGVKNYPEVDVYPTIEVIDRLHPPRGKELKFPVPVELTSEELQMAAAGAFITRVIYVEDPNQALPIEQKKDEQQWFEARPEDDPLLVADTLGRPVAILRIGARGPGMNGIDAKFTYGSPPVQLYEGVAR